MNKSFLVFSFSVLFSTAVLAGESESKVCAIDLKKIEIGAVEALRAKLETLECVKGDILFIWQQASWGSAIMRNKIAGAQLCNLSKPHTLNSQGGSTNNHHVICEYTGSVLKVNTTDKEIIKAFKK